MNAKSESPNSKPQAKRVEITTEDHFKVQARKVEASLDARFGKEERFKGRWTERGDIAANFSAFVVVFVLLMMFFTGCVSQAQLRAEREVGYNAGFRAGNRWCEDDVEIMKEAAGQLNARLLECLEADKEK